MVAGKNANLFTPRLENVHEIQIKLLSPKIFSQQESPSQSKHLFITIKIIIFCTQSDNQEMSREVESGGGGNC